MAFLLRHVQKSKFGDSHSFWTRNFLISFFTFPNSPFLIFCSSDWPSTGLTSSLKTSEKASLRWAIMKFCSKFFTQISKAFLCPFHAQLTQSLWSGYWKDLFLLQNPSDATFSQRWWRKKWNKGQHLSQVVTGGTGINVWNYFFLFQLYFGPTPSQQPWNQTSR